MRMFRAVAWGFALAAVTCFAFIGGLQEEAGLLIYACFLAGFSAAGLLVTRNVEGG